MDIPPKRLWIYNRTNPRRGGCRVEYIQGIETFIEHASKLEPFIREGVIHCSCKKCIRKYDLLKPDELRRHLYANGFKTNYWYWTDHGETAPPINHWSATSSIDHGAPSNTNNQYYEDPLSRYRDMYFDVVMQDVGGMSGYCEAPNPETQRFYDMLDEFNKLVWDGCDKHSPLSVAARILSIQNDYNATHDLVDDFIELMSDLGPRGHNVPRNFYEAKKLVHKLGLQSIKIDCCVKGCMLFYKEDEELTECKFCGAARYEKKENERGKRKKTPVSRIRYLPLIPRLKRLYASMSSAPHMTWHANYQRLEGTMSHPSDGHAWKYFDLTHPECARDSRNVRFSLCADGFTPYSQSATPYSCWPVIVTPYNLPPEMYMTMPYLFLTCIIPGPNNPKQNIDVYLQPLIDELKELWEVGMPTYDASRKQNFNLKLP